MYSLSNDVWKYVNIFKNQLVFSGRYQKLGSGSATDELV